MGLSGGEGLAHYSNKAGKRKKTGGGLTANVTGVLLSGPNVPGRIKAGKLILLAKELVKLLDAYPRDFLDGTRHISCIEPL